MAANSRYVGTPSRISNHPVTGHHDYTFGFKEERTRHDYVKQGIPALNKFGNDVVKPVVNMMPTMGIAKLAGKAAKSFKR